MKAANVFDEYLNKIDHDYRTGKATEHTYRGALRDLVAALLPGTTVLNEPKRIECGAPDFIITRSKLPVAFIEAKDIGDSDLDGRKTTGNKEQFDRYRASLDHIVFTDYLDFHFYENGAFAESVRIAEDTGGSIKAIPGNFARFETLVRKLGSAAPQKIKSASQLSKLMAGKARLLEQATLKLLVKPGSGKTSIGKLMADFRRTLVPDVTVKDFADVYAQTITYGMFAARLHDHSSVPFTRLAAAALIPKSNPFLKQLFSHIATGLEDELEWIVDDLATMFGASDVGKIMAVYGKATSRGDPMIHFYEDFLRAYDAGLRKDRGVWYTPLPVVKFIVRAVDEILEKSFGLPDGLATRDKVEIEVEEDCESGKKATRLVKKSVHKVQILDPATGTGTFLAECVNRIHGKFAGHNSGKWNGYVKDDLLPRLNGFEILMASYTMAHVKLDMTLAGTGYKHSGDGRFNIFLTNSLEEYTAALGPLFAAALGEEANAAKFIKRDCPVMVVMGNPPYSVSSQNKGPWIENLVADYKKPLKERNIQPLSDDYIKFIRLGQHYVEKNGEGILAYISNNSFLDGLIHRQMRKSLLETFDDIFVLNLHGNSRKRETAPDGDKDENVFSIMRGVSINIFVKRRATRSPKPSMACVRYCDLYGRRKDKFEWLESVDFKDVKWQILELKEPYFFYVPKNFGLEEEYKMCFGIGELMCLNTCGIKTHHDAELVSTEAFQTEFNRRFHYRHLDQQWIDYDLSKVVRHRYAVMKHLLSDNLAICVVKNSRDGRVGNYLVANCLVGKDCVSPLDNCYVFPLYLYEESFGKVERRPNFDSAIYDKISASIKHKPTPEEVFDYIYAVLHTPEYRSRYREFLKVDFPRIPYPKSAEAFDKLVAFGLQLRNAHLLKDKHSQFEKVAAFAVAGSNTVEGVRFESGRVFINDTQYFDNVPEDIFGFYIGGYQPAQKWLKDRRGRTLTNDDCDHYQSIILALVKTRDLMAVLSKFSSVWL